MFTRRERRSLFYLLKIMRKTDKLRVGVQALIETCKEFGLSYEDAKVRVQSKFNLSEEETESLSSKYW